MLLPGATLQLAYLCSPDSSNSSSSCPPTDRRPSPLPQPLRSFPPSTPPPTHPPYLPQHTNTSEGKPIPTELRKDESQLRREIELEDDNTAVPRSHIDDEYGHAGEADPKVLLTTSRDPSSRLIQFAKVGVGGQGREGGAGYG